MVDPGIVQDRPETRFRPSGVDCGPRGWGPRRGQIWGYLSLSPVSGESSFPANLRFRFLLFPALDLGRSSWPPPTARPMKKVGTVKSRWGSPFLIWPCCRRGPGFIPGFFWGQYYGFAKISRVFLDFMFRDILEVKYFGRSPGASIPHGCPQDLAAAIFRSALSGLRSSLARHVSSRHHLRPVLAPPGVSLEDKAFQIWG